MKALEGSVLNFTIDDIRRSMWYDVIVRYEPIHPGVWEDVQIILERDSPPDPNGPCADWRPEQDRLRAQLPLRSRSATAQPAVCLSSRHQVLVNCAVKNTNGIIATSSLTKSTMCGVTYPISAKSIRIALAISFSMVLIVSSVIRNVWCHCFDWH